MAHKFAGPAVFIVGVATAAAAQAATITVPANGDLQGAINSAQPGDVIQLQPGAVYVGNFVLPAKSNPNGLTITSRSSASTLPGPGQRILPAHAGQLPKLRSPNVVSVL